MEGNLAAMEHFFISFLSLPELVNLKSLRKTMLIKCNILCCVSSTEYKRKREWENAQNVLHLGGYKRIDQDMRFAHHTRIIVIVVKS